MQQLAEHGIMKPPAMQGLTDDQIEELKLVDEFATKVRPGVPARFPARFPGSPRARPGGSATRAAAAR